MQPCLKVRDFTVSQELFEIWHCDDCSIRFTQNVPKQEAIGRYYQSEDYISHSDTSRGLINRLYRIVRKFTMMTKRKIVTSSTGLSSGNLLDVGAGTGSFAAFMQQSGWTVSALEPDEAARKKAAVLHSLQVADARTLFELPPSKFDAITLWHVIEHVHELHRYIEQLGALLAPEGRLFIAVPNYTSFDATHYDEFWAAYDTPRHLYHFSPASMRILLKQYGLQIKSVRPMWFDSFYVSLLSEKYKSGNPNLVKGFWNGAVSNAKALINHQKASSLIYIISKSSG